MNAETRAKEVTLLAVAMAVMLSACVADDEQVKVWRESEVARICPDGAVVLQYQGRLYRIVGGFPKAFVAATPLSETCTPTQKD